MAWPCWHVHVHHVHVHVCMCMCACACVHVHVCMWHVACVHVHVQALQQLGHTVAPAWEARGFAVESVWHDAPCGMHKAYNYLPAAQLAQLLRGVERAYGRLAREAQSKEAKSSKRAESPSASAVESG